MKVLACSIKLWTCLLLTVSVSLWGLNVSIPADEAEAIATEAYIYGYPLVTMEITRRVMTNVSHPEEHSAPMGQFANSRKYPDASFKAVTALNADTLYSTAWLDLFQEPYVLHVPDVGDRYYLMPMLSAWTEVFAAPGTRTTGTKKADFLIKGPEWKGNVPQGMKQIKSPTNLVWILGRTYSTGTLGDYAAVHAIQDQYKLTPLSEYGKEYSPSSNTPEANVEMSIAVRTQVDHMSAETFFGMLSLWMGSNPPAAEDAALINRLKKIGIVPGKIFLMQGMDPAIVKALEKGREAGLNKIQEASNKIGGKENGWTVTTDTGNYGMHYLRRAVTAAIGLGANKPEDAVYPFTEVDVEGNPLTGQSKYVLHFDKGGLPPVNAFWSLTMYNDKFFFADNSLNRYTLSPRDPLKYNEDGSLDLFIQQEVPEEGKKSNWLPAPKDKFVLMLRLYWPKEEVLKGSWKPPGVRKIAEDQKHH